jgi:hypothetical protein
MSFPGWAGAFDPGGQVSAWSPELDDGETTVLAEFDPARLADRRRNVYLVPRCLRPELYLALGPEDWVGLKKGSRCR